MKGSKGKSLLHTPIDLLILVQTSQIYDKVKFTKKLINPGALYWTNVIQKLMSCIPCSKLTRNRDIKFRNILGETILLESLDCFI